jgi:hypothetical protein
MTATAAIDPLAVFLNRARQTDQAPIPLRATSFDVVIESGLAMVTTTRLFQNAEPSTIEATLTFPVPVHAVLFSLEVKIGKRRLAARGSRKQEARASYEEGIEEGMTSILHEELLRGIHMLSVGHIPPGETIEVKTDWAMPLTLAGNQGHLRIPTTVGQVYGRSPLSDGDDFAWTDTVQTADVTIRCTDAPVHIEGKTYEGGTLKLPMNGPIDISVDNWSPGVLAGRGADGSRIELNLSPAPVSSAALDVAILVDHSGSMNSKVRKGERGETTTHELVISGLHTLSPILRRGDVIDVWEFDSTPRHVGNVTGDHPGALKALAGRLTPPQGGTEIGLALETVLSTSEAGSILLITDGNSHALDVHKLAGRGKRISVILVGDDSLEANVGHLAALSGGEIFIAAGDQVDKVFAAAVEALRTPAGSGAADRSKFHFGGQIIRLKRSPGEAASERTPFEHGVAAMAAALLLPRLEEDDAAALAETEGMVTHLTSLVLVDNAGAVQEGLPLRRRVPLSRPGTVLASMSMAPSLSSRSRGVMFSVGDQFAPSPNLPIPANLADMIRALADAIDWDTQGPLLARGDTSKLPKKSAGDVAKLTQDSGFVRLARSHGADPLHLAIALMAWCASQSGDRAATRVFKALEKENGLGNIGGIATSLGLD